MNKNHLLKMQKAIDILTTINAKELVYENSSVIINNCIQNLQNLYAANSVIEPVVEDA